MQFRDISLRIRAIFSRQAAKELYWVNTQKELDEIRQAEYRDSAYGELWWQPVDNAYLRDNGNIVLTPHSHLAVLRLKKPIRVLDDSFSPEWNDILRSVFVYHKKENDLSVPRARFVPLTNTKFSGEDLPYNSGYVISDEGYVTHHMFTCRDLEMLIDIGENVDPLYLGAMAGLHNLDSQAYDSLHNLNIA
ncbi:MAG: hypothetical protein IT558_04120 [Alphaproteobacteria bacterium]|nr:hypothetical protein [Alphaproteobacteria bacterium]